MITVKEEKSNVIGSGPYLVVNFDTDAEKDQLRVLLGAAAIYAVKNVRYKDSWKRMGWRGQLVRVRERSERLWDSLWNAANDSHSMAGGVSEHEIPLDDAFDLINFAGFLIRAVHDGNRDGSWWEGM